MWACTVSDGPLGSRPMGSMRAAVLEADGKLAVGQVDIEDPRPGEVLVRVTDCGVCHSDLSSLDGSFPMRVKVGNAKGTQVDVRGAPFDMGPHVRDNVARFEVK